MELIWLEKQYSCLPSDLAVIDTLPCESLRRFSSACSSGSVNCISRHQGSLCAVGGSCTHPEINVKMPASSHLVRDRHLDSL